MLVLNNEGEIFDERRRKKRRVDNSLKDVALKDIDDAMDRRQEERRKKDINATKRRK